MCRLLPLLCVGGMVMCELLWHVLDGLNKLLAAIACGGVACMLLGALLAVVVLRVRRKNAVSAAEHGQ